MNKIDKFLYGGFAVVIIAGIVVMLMSVKASGGNRKDAKSRATNDGNGLIGRRINATRK